MAAIKKNDGNTEPFDREKIISSLRTAGMNATSAREVAAEIKEKNGMTTNDIRRLVTKELNARNTKIAQNYNETRRLSVRNKMAAAKGYAHLNRNTMNQMNVKDGENLDILFAGKHQILKARKDNANQNEIWLNSDDINSINATEGTRVAVTHT